MNTKQGRCLYWGSIEKRGAVSGWAYPRAMAAFAAVALAAGFWLVWGAVAEGATDVGVTLSPQGVPFPPPEYASLPLWDHLHVKPPDKAVKYYNTIRGRDSYELLAAVYGGRPSAYWAPGVFEWDEALGRWVGKSLSPGDTEWKPYPASYLNSDHDYLSGNGRITLAAGEYQLGQGAIMLGRHYLPDGTELKRNSITIKGAGKDRTFLNGNYLRDSLIAGWNDDTGGVTLEIRDLSVSATVGTMGSVGFTLSNVRVDIPPIGHSDPLFATFGFKHDQVGVYVDNGYDDNIENVTVENCDFVVDYSTVLLSIGPYPNYDPPSPRTISMTGNSSISGSTGYWLSGGWNGEDSYADKVITNNRMELRQAYTDSEPFVFEGIYCGTSGSALIANNEIKFTKDAPYVWGIEVGTYIPAVDVVVKNNRIYQTFSGQIGALGGGFGITVGGYWGSYTPSHDNIFMGNNLTNLRPSMGTYYLGRDAYDNIIVGNAGTVGYDSWEPSPIPNNFVTGLTPMKGAPHIGPAVSDILKLKRGALNP